MPGGGRQVSVEGPAGGLEVLIEEPDGSPTRGVAVICHPHPLHGGSMHNKVVHTLARALRRVGCVVLRFNFRGVGRSGGEFAGGGGELNDALAVCRWARAQWPDVPFALAGFSFGAAIAIAAAVRERPFGLISVAPPVGRLLARDAETPACPWLIVQGDADELVDCAQVLDWVNGLAPGPEVALLRDGDHFFHGRLIELRDIVVQFLQTLPELRVQDD